MPIYYVISKINCFLCVFYSKQGFVSARFARARPRFARPCPPPTPTPHAGPSDNAIWLETSFLLQLSFDNTLSSKININWSIFPDKENQKIKTNNIFI